MGAPKMTSQNVERNWAMMRRYLPLLEFLEGKKFGLVIVQLHGGRPVKMGHLPGLEAVEEVEAVGEETLDDSREG